MVNLGFNFEVHISSLLNIGYTIILYQECRYTAFVNKRKKIYEIKAKSGIHCQGRAGEEGGGADPAPMVNVLWAYKLQRDRRIFDWVGYNTLIRKTQSKLELK